MGGADLRPAEAQRGRRPECRRDREVPAGEREDQVDAGDARERHEEPTADVCAGFTAECPAHDDGRKGEVVEESAVASLGVHLGIERSPIHDPQGRFHSDIRLVVGGPEPAQVLIDSDEAHGCRNDHDPDEHIARRPPLRGVVH